MTTQTATTTTAEASSRPPFRIQKSDMGFFAEVRQQGAYKDTGQRINSIFPVFAQEPATWAIVTPQDERGYARPTREEALADVDAYFSADADAHAEGPDTYQGVTYPAQCERM